MNYMGIDVSKYKHDCCIVSDSDDILKQDFSFQNDATGFAKLEKELQLCGKGNIQIGMESTGNYAINLKLFLEKIGFAFMEINPLLVKEHLRGKSLRRTTTDKLSARAIADYMLSNDFHPHQTDFYGNFALKQLTRFRSRLVSVRSSYLVQITNVLDCIFPEFKPFFDEKFTVTALYILANYPTAEAISNMNSRSYDILRRKSRGHFSLDKFVTLKQLAKNTVGLYHNCYGLELAFLLDLHSHIDRKIDQIDSDLSRIISTLNPPILSVKGIGHVSCASILSEFGDISRFENPNKMLSFAGLEPGYFKSGTAEHLGRMVKHGSPHLRNTLLSCCRSLRLHNEVFAAYYRKKTSEGKSESVALTHMAKKLIRLIFALQSNGEPYDPAKMR